MSNLVCLGWLSLFTGLHDYFYSNIFRLYIANDPGCTVSEMYISKVHFLFRLTLLLLLIYFNDLRLNYLDDDSRLGYKNKNQRSDYRRQKR